MRMWGGSSPKRTLLFSNGKSVFHLWTGRLVKSKYPTTVQTAKKYVDSSGCVRYQGTPALKGTQLPDKVEKGWKVLFVFGGWWCKWKPQIFPKVPSDLHFEFGDSFAGFFFWSNKVIPCGVCWSSNSSCPCDEKRAQAMVFERTFAEKCLVASTSSFSLHDFQPQL